jgi:hypothetical protein
VIFTYYRSLSAPERIKDFHSQAVAGLYSATFTACISATLSTALFAVVRQALGALAFAIVVFVSVVIVIRTVRLIFYSLGMPSGRKPLISLRAVVKYCEM